MGAKKGRGLLMVYVDVPAACEDEFNRWYNEEHIPERLAIPGVLNAARYEAVRGGPKYLACYELHEPEAYFSDPWQRCLANPTPWTQRMSPRTIGSRFVRNLYRLIYPDSVSEEMAQAEMSPALLVGRMDVPSHLDATFNTAEFIPLSFWYDAPLISRYSDRRHDPWLVYGSLTCSPAPRGSWIAPA